MSTKTKVITKGILAWFGVITIILSVVWGCSGAFERLAMNDTRDVKEHGELKVRVEVLSNVASNTAILLAVMTNDLKYIRKNVEDLKAIWLIRGF
jgi:hypothetical protein